MKHTFHLIWLLLLPLCLMAQQKEERTIVTLNTTEGVIVIALCNETPLHRDNFVRKVKEGVYNGRCFNRVIAGFVIQCGEEEAEDVIPAEIRYPKLHHRRGAVAMGRCTDDPTHELKSASEQFYIAWGDVSNERQLQRDDSLMRAWSYGNCQMEKQMHQYYSSHPGIPFLDGSYTIFGEVVSGLDVVERIQATTTDDKDRPLKEVTILQATVTKEWKEN